MATFPFTVLFPPPDWTGGRSLSGTYVHQSPAGAVTLTLEQQGATVAGQLVDAAGAVSALEGLVENDTATGAIRIGGGAWFVAVLVGDRLKLVVAHINPETGQPDPDHSWSLELARSGGGTPDAAGGPTGGARPEPAEGPGRESNAGASAAVLPPQDESSPLVREWLVRLRGRKLTYQESYFSSGIGGGGGYSSQWEAYLCSDGTFLFQQRSGTHIDTGGLVGTDRDGQTARGVWRVSEHGGRAVLQYRMDGGAPQQAVLTYQNGATFLDRSRVYVTDDNPYCR